jgi:adenylate cyclase
MSEKRLGVFLREFEARAHDVSAECGARVVKLIGDEVMFVAAAVDAACAAALALTAAFDDAGDHVLPRGGLAYGYVLSRGGDYHGSVVNLAARLADQAVPQEVLVDAAVVEHASDTSFTAGGRRMAKGFAEPIRVWSIDRGPRPA